MEKNRKMRLLYAALAGCVAVGLSAIPEAKADDVNVSTFAELQTAVNDGNNAVLTSDVSISGTTFDGNGQSINVTSGNTLTIQDAIVQNLTGAADGGGIQVDGGTVDIKATTGDVSITGNNAGAFGSTVYNNGGTVNITTTGDNKVTFSGNSSDGGATAIRNQAGTATIGNNVTFENNYSTQHDADPISGSFGAVSNHGTATMTIGNNVKFSNNGYTGSPLSTVGAFAGGALYNDSDVTIGDNAKFENNVSLGGGGAIYNGGSPESNIGITGGVAATLEIGANAKFIGNSSSEGGAIYTQICASTGNTLDIGTGATFSTNTADNGGAITSYGTEINIGSGANFTGNTATADGGAIYADEYQPSANPKASQTNTTIDANSTFSGNKANNGGAVYNASGEFTINGATSFTGNQAKTAGGAIYNADSLVLDTTTGATVGSDTVYDITFSGNTVGGNTAGADLYFADGSSAEIKGDNGTVSFGDGVSGAVLTDGSAGYSITHTGANTVEFKGDSSTFTGSYTQSAGKTVIDSAFGAEGEFSGGSLELTSNAQLGSDLTVTGDMVNLSIDSNVDSIDWATGEVVRTDSNITYDAGKQVDNLTLNNVQLGSLLARSTDVIEVGSGKVYENLTLAEGSSLVGQLDLEDGTITIDGGDSSVDPAIPASSLTITDGSAVKSGTIDNAGALNVVGGATVDSSSSITGTGGTVTKSGEGTFEIDGTLTTGTYNQNAGTTQIDNTFTATTYNQNDGTTEINAASAITNYIQADGTTDINAALTTGSYSQTGGTTEINAALTTDTYSQTGGTTIINSDFTATTSADFGAGNLEFKSNADLKSDITISEAVNVEIAKEFANNVDWDGSIKIGSKEIKSGSVVGSELTINDANGDNSLLGENIVIGTDKAYKDLTLSNSNVNTKTTTDPETISTVTSTGGSVTLENNSTLVAKVTSNAGTFDVESGSSQTIASGSTIKNAVDTAVKNAGALTVTGATFETNATAIDNSGTLTVNGGTTFDGNTTAAITNSSSLTLDSTAGDITFGETTVNGVDLNQTAGTTTISGAVDKAVTFNTGVAGVGAIEHSGSNTVVFKGNSKNYTGTYTQTTATDGTTIIDGTFIDNTASFAVGNLRIDSNAELVQNITIENNTVGLDIRKSDLGVEWTSGELLVNSASSTETGKIVLADGVNTDLTFHGIDWTSPARDIILGTATDADGNQSRFNNVTFNDSTLIGKVDSIGGTITLNNSTETINGTSTIKGAVGSAVQVDGTSELILSSGDIKFSENGADIEIKYTGKVTVNSDANVSIGSGITSTDSFATMTNDGDITFEKNSDSSSFKGTYTQNSGTTTIDGTFIGGNVFIDDGQLNILNNAVLPADIVIDDNDKVDVFVSAAIDAIDTTTSGYVSLTDSVGDISLGANRIDLTIDSAANKDMVIDAIGAGRTINDLTFINGAGLKAATVLTVKGDSSTLLSTLTFGDGTANHSDNNIIMDDNSKMVLGSGNGTLNLAANIKSASDATGEIVKDVTGTLNITGDNSGFTGTYNQSKGTTNLEDGSYFFGGDSSIKGGNLVVKDGSHLSSTGSILVEATLSIVENEDITFDATGQAIQAAGSPLYGVLVVENAQDEADGVRTTSIDRTTGKVTFIDTNHKDGAGDSVSSTVQINNAGLHLANGYILQKDEGDTVFNLLPDGGIRELILSNGSGIEGDILAGHNAILTYHDDAFVDEDAVLTMKDNAILNLVFDTDKTFGKTIESSSNTDHNQINKTGSGTAEITTAVEDFGGSISVLGGGMQFDKETKITGDLTLANGTEFTSIGEAAAKNITAGDNTEMTFFEDLAVQNTISIGKSSAFDAAENVTTNNLIANDNTKVSVGESLSASGDITIGNSNTLLVGDDLSAKNFYSNTVSGAANTIYVGDTVSVANDMVLANSSLNVKNEVSVGNDLTVTNTNLNLAGGKVTPINVGNTTTIAGANTISLDADGRGYKNDGIVTDNLVVDAAGATIEIGDVNFVATPRDYNFNLQVVRSNTQSGGDLTIITNDKIINTPVGKYMLIAGSNGNIGGKLVEINPQAYRGQVASVAVYANQLAQNNILFDHINLLAHQSMAESKTANHYATVNPQFAPYQYTMEDGGLWYKAYANFETIGMDRGLNVHNNFYGSLIGADLPAIDLQKGWKVVPTAYVAYNGAHQAFHGVSMYQNGAQIGAMGTAYKGDFLTSLLVYGGGYYNNMSVAGYEDRTGNWFAGAASKSAYNVHLPADMILQPNFLMSYTAVGEQNWHSNYGIIDVHSGMLNGINVAPGLNLIWNKETFSIYGTAQLMFNVMGTANGQTGNIYLPSVGMRHCAYFEYGLGATKRIKDRLNSYLQITIRNGARTGIGFQGGFQWRI